MTRHLPIKSYSEVFGWLLTMVRGTPIPLAGPWFRRPWVNRTTNSQTHPKYLAHDTQQQHPSQHEGTVRSHVSCSYLPGMGAEDGWVGIYLFIYLIIADRGL
jgi:hypothetical protein